MTLSGKIFGPTAADHGGAGVAIDGGMLGNNLLDKALDLGRQFFGDLGRTVFTNASLLQFKASGGNLTRVKSVDTPALAVPELEMEGGQLSALANTAAKGKHKHPNSRVPNTGKARKTLDLAR